jgi:hypothetical protein
VVSTQSTTRFNKYVFFFFFFFYKDKNTRGRIGVTVRDNGDNEKAHGSKAREDTWR